MQNAQSTILQWSARIKDAQSRLLEPTLSSQDVNQIAEEASSLRQELTDSADELPSRELARCEKELAALLEAVSSARTRLSAPSKFTFKRRQAATASIDSSTRPVEPVVSAPVASTNEITNSSTWPTSSLVLSNRHDLLITSSSLPTSSSSPIDSASSSAPPPPLVLNNVSNCLIDLSSSNSSSSDHRCRPSIYVSNISNSILRLPVVENGSIFVDNVQESLIVLSSLSEEAKVNTMTSGQEDNERDGGGQERGSSLQLRIHNSQDLIIVVPVGSEGEGLSRSGSTIIVRKAKGSAQRNKVKMTRPVIEHCKRITLTNVNVFDNDDDRGVGEEDDDDEEEEEGNDEWTRVQDFDQPFEKEDDEEEGDDDENSRQRRPLKIKRKTNWSLVKLCLGRGRVGLGISKEEFQHEGGEWLLPWLKRSTKTSERTNELFVVDERWTSTSLRQSNRQALIDGLQSFFHRDCNS
ncbi:hypothetical protein ACM66B_002443 [Microbotryomycetes sp. NB124-2]